MTTTNQKVGAKQGRGAKAPVWHRLRDALADISRGLYPQRAFDYHHLPQQWLNDSRLQPRIRHAEAACQLTAINGMHEAGGKGMEPLDRTPDGRARVGTRVWVNKDWRAPAWLLERRFPREYGAQVAPDVGSQVVEVIKAMAQLRASVAGQPPQGLPTSLIARPALPATVEGAPTGARAREGGGETGEPGTPR